MKWCILLLIFVIVPLFYYFVLIPNYKMCIAHVGTWQACIQWLIR